MIHKKSTQIFIGTSGWQYEHWRDCFYPVGIAVNKRFSFYQTIFNTVEINSTFYHLPRETTFTKWYNETGADFIFVLKAWKVITHLKKINNCEEALVLFLKRARLLKEKLGAILYQLPPQLKKNKILLENFLKLLPNDTKHVIEFRDNSWNEELIFSLLKKYRVAYCIVSAPDLNCQVRATTDIAYVRFHGIFKWYNYNYTAADLAWWATQIQTNLAADKIFCFFNNDAFGYAPANAISFLKMCTV